MSCLSDLVLLGNLQIKLLPLESTAPADPRWLPGGALQGLSWVCLEVTHPYLPHVCDIKAGQEH